MEEPAANELDQWRELFLGQYQVRDAFKEFDQSSERLLSLFFSLKFDTGIDALAGGMLIDIGQHNESRTITAVGTTFSKSVSELHVGCNPIVFRSDLEERAGGLAFDGEKKRLSDSAHGWIQYQIDGNAFRLVDLSATLTYWLEREKDFVPVGRWGFEEYRSRACEVLCGSCYGEGLIKGMAIPKADWEAGLSGYALYSSSRVNGARGCTACGGGGVQYEPWYLEENPDLAKEPLDFRKGTGFKPHTPRSEAVLPRLED
jgi:sorbitol-specific phosphotransferase system component IIA